MTDRRRNLFVLLLVARADRRLARSSSRRSRRKLGLDLKGGVQLVYQGKPTAAAEGRHAEAIDRALDIMRERVDAFGVAEPEIQRAGTDQIDGRPARRQERRARGAAGRHDRPAVLLRLGDERPRAENCKTDPTNADGHAAARRPARPAGCRSTTRSSARRKCTPATNTGRRRPTAALLPRSTTGTKKPFARPERRPTDLTRRARRRASAPARGTPRSSRSARARSSCAAEKASAKQGPADALLRPARPPGAVAARTSRTRSRTSTSGRGNGSRSSRSTSPTRAARRSRRSRARSPSAARTTRCPAATRRQRLPALRDRARQRARLGRRTSTTSENPDGIDGSNGARSPGGFTIQSAQDLAKMLKIGALPIKLELISRSQVSATLGKQALTRASIAGLVGLRDRRALPARLLPRPRPDRGRARSASTRSTSSR